MGLRIKRIYDTASSEDGFRVLVDRLWPRGVSKEKARLDLWLKDIAPSPELRVWFDHDPTRFKEFSIRYETELDSNSAIDEIGNILKQHKVITFLYGAKDPHINHAVVLKEYLKKLKA